MEKLNYLDSSFLRLESPRHPFHVAGLLVFKLPENAPKNYMRKIAARAAQFNEIWPILNKKLTEPEDVANSAWTSEKDFSADRHILRYALPQPGRMEDLLNLVSRAHERQLDRSRPLWELHIIEGLPGDRFALYCKVHHSLIDGAGAMKMMHALFSPSPGKRLDPKQAARVIEHHEGRQTLLGELGDVSRTLLEQYRAIPQLSSMLSRMGLDTLRGRESSMTLPFTAPRTIFNTEMDPARRIILCDLPFKPVRAMAHKLNGSINDVLLAICGGALRRYLLEQNALPRKSLIAGLPVSIKPKDKQEGNHVSFILCPYYTNEKDELKRVQRIIKTTRKAKATLGNMSTTAQQDFGNLMLMPAVLLTLTGNATKVTPVVNAIFSNVPGSSEKLYLEGAELESLYPLSVITDSMGLNLTVVSYGSKLCFAVTSCPTQQPGIEKLDRHLKESYRELRDALKQQ